MTQDDNLLTTREVATRLRISVQTVIKLIRSGHLDARRVGNLWRISEASVNKYLNSSETGKENQ